MSVKKLSELSNIDDVKGPGSKLVDEDLLEVSLNDQPLTGNKLSANVTFEQLKDSIGHGLLDNDTLDGESPGGIPSHLHAPTQANVKTYVDNVEFGDLANVDSSTPSTNDLIKWDGSQFTYTDSTTTAHSLLGESHNDTNNVVATYGDSLVYDGIEWTPGRFGDWAYDTEYISVTGCTGATFTGDIAIQPTDLVFDAAGLGQGLSGTLTWTIPLFEGDGLNANNIRGIYIKLLSILSEHFNDLWVNYPDGTEVPINYNHDSVAFDSNHNKYRIIFIPINAGQSSLEFRWTKNNSPLCEDEGGIIFTIMGAQCTKRMNLSPEIETIHILATAAANGDSISASTLIQNSEFAWSSDNPTIKREGNGTSINMDNIFPIEIGNDVSKTVIHGNYVDFAASASNDENQAHTDITIDWVNNKVTGTFAINCGDSTGYNNGGIIEGTISSITMTTEMKGTHSTYSPSLTIANRTIISLPIFQEHRSATFQITNYKTSQYEYNNDHAIHYSGEIVKSSPLPASWTDIDLTLQSDGSTLTGLTGRNFVHLRVDTDVDDGVLFRPNDQVRADVADNVGEAAGTSASSTLPTSSVYISLITDANGIIEWKRMGTSAGTTTNVTLLTYQKLITD